MYRVTNLQKTASLIIYDVRDKPVTIAPGTHLDIDMTDEAADRFRRRNVATFEKVDGPMSTETLEPPGQSGEVREGVRAAPPHAQDTPMVIMDKKKLLVTQLQEKRVSFQEFVAQAKVLMGDNWPGGSPKKSAVVALLLE